MQFKICTVCGESKDIGCFYKAKRGKYGVEAICKSCSKAKYERNKGVQLAKQRQRYKENPEVFNARSSNYRENNKDEISLKASARYKEHRAENYEDCLLKEAEYRLKNSKRLAEYKKKWAEDNYERLKELRKTAYLSDRENNIKKASEWSKLNRGRSRTTKRKWAVSNPDKVAHSRLRRRNVKKQCVPAWADSEWDNFLVKEICDLARLRTEVTGFAWHVDHKVPLISKIVCGLHCADNLQAIPASINLAKSNLIWEHMP